MRYPYEKITIIFSPMKRNESAYLRCHQDLNGTRLKQSLDDALVLLAQSLMEVPNSMLESLDEAFVGNVVQMRLEVVQVDVEE